MNTANPETRSLAFVLLVVALSAGARLARTGPGVVVGAGLDLDSLESASATALADVQRRARPLEPGERIPVNTAPAAELARLPRVGPALADRIVAERERGSFRSLSDLERVAGIGPRTAEMLAPHLDFTGVAVRRGRRPGSVELPRDRPASRLDLLPGRVPAGTVRAGGIDLNRADAEALQRLPGIGPVMAARIVAHRDSAGPFGSLDDLTAVSGIGPATVARLRDFRGGS